MDPRPKSNAAKLSVDDVLRIRRLHAEGRHTPNALATIYKVTADNINRILRRATWTHV